MKSILAVSNLTPLFFVLAMAAGPANAFFSEMIKIQSLESKTIQGQPVFNEITWFSYRDKDVWMMNQSHRGENTSADQKDRLAIIIDKTKSPKTAYFIQLKPGPLVWSEDLYLQKVAFKVSCFICHSNGLRTIRANFDGSTKLNPVEIARLNYFNYKINSYGFVKESENHPIEDANLQTPFRFQTAFDNQPLKIESCRSCHDGKSRSELRRQNFIAIQFMVDNKLMPPDPGKLSKKEIRQIRNFTRGL